jgi:DNA processing protein
MTDLTELSARVQLSLLAVPADPVLGAMLADASAEELATALNRGGALPHPEGVQAAARPARGGAWRARADRLAPRAAAETVQRMQEVGARTVLPGEPEWPTQLDALGAQRPYLLWVRGTGDLRNRCLRSGGVVGARAATDYGLHVAGDLGHDLAQRGWCPVSGGAYGVDGAVHRGALAAGQATVVVAATGPDLDHPRGHERLFAAIADSGLLVGELPPGRRPTRHGFLVRNRLIAALTPGTVVVEAARRSGAMNTARHARELHRHLMAVPGPVTSGLSAGCHELLREWDAVCVTEAAEVVEQVGALGGDLAPESGAPRLAEGPMDGAARAVLDCVPERSGAGPAQLAAAVGCDVASVLRHLGLLAAAGLVERTDSGWRRRAG